MLEVVQLNLKWCMDRRRYGDLINTMITAAIAVLFILLIEERVGSMALIVFPTIVGGLSATIGIFTLPYVRLITTGIGNMLNSFTELQPVLMSMLISMVFSFIIISPLSTVAVQWQLAYQVLQLVRHQ